VSQLGHLLASVDVGEMLDAFNPCFLEKEPLHGYFGALDHDTSHRWSKDDKFKLIILQLKENAWV
jgi:hypothetical protein